MLSRPFCALILGVCLALMPFTAWVAFLNAQLGQISAARTCLWCVLAQAGVAILEVVILSR